MRLIVLILLFHSGFKLCKLKVCVYQTGVKRSCDLYICLMPTWFLSWLNYEVSFFTWFGSAIG